MASQKDAYLRNRHKKNEDHPHNFTERSLLKEHVYTNLTRKKKSTSWLHKKIPIKGTDTNLTRKKGTLVASQKDPF